MMAKDPARRFQAPDEVAQALAPFADAQAARAAATRRDATASAEASTMAAASARRQESPTAPGWRRAEATTLKAASPTLAPAIGDDKPERQTAAAGAQPRRLWLPIAAALAMLAAGAGYLALITYRIQTATGELVIESDDPSIELIVKQGGKQVTIVDTKTSHRIELNVGSYELQLAGGGEGLKLSTETFMLKRGDRTIVTVQREAPKPHPASDLLAGAGTEEVGEIARFQSPHDFVGAAFLLPDGRRVIYASAGGYEKDTWVEPREPALWLGELADPKNPRKFTGAGPGGLSLALSKDGRLALTCGGDKTLRLWDVETGKSRRVRREETGLSRVAFSPDERHAAYVCYDMIRLCDLKMGDELMTFREHSGRIDPLAFCPDGRRLVSGGADDHTIRVWNVETGEEIRQMKHGHGVMSIAVFPDGRRALTGSWDRTIGVWDLETRQQLRRIVGVAEEFGANVAISPDGRRALFGTHYDHAVRLWDLETGEPLERLEGHSSWVNSVAFASDGRRALSSSGDKTVCVWALPPGRPPGAEPPLMEVAHFLGHDRPIEAVVAVSPDGRRLLSGSNDKTLILWDRQTAQPIRRFSGHTADVLAVAMSSVGRRALSGGDDMIVRLWDLESGETIRELHGHKEWIFSVAFSPDGRLGYSTSGGITRDWQDGTDAAIRVWDLENGQEVRKLEGHKGLVWSVAVSPDGRRVLSGGQDGSRILWDPNTGAMVRRLGGNTRVRCVAFLPDGRRAVSGGEDRTIRLCEVETGQEIHGFQGHSREITWIAVSPDGRRLLSSSYEGRELLLWDVETGKPIHRINWGQVNPTRGSFAPDGRHAVWGGMDGVIRMYRLPAPDQVKTDQPAAPAQPTAAQPP